ncbi:MAG: DUF1343 domain-containing protein [Bacteroidales bacterium]|nr:DUF1343 domain-containing protein [Bacteroidales bacterium]
MFKQLFPFIFLFFLFETVFSQDSSNILYRTITIDDINVGAERTELYFPIIKDKNLAIVANHTAMIGQKHLVDSLIGAGMHIRKVFAPEHGFRGNADAGEYINNYTDSITGLPVISLYGTNKKPKSSDLQGIDIVIFDIQDVGARFYTYISTLHYVMEACAENNITLLILDRPNPNGFYVDGPVLEPQFKSFVGMHPVPIVHGMTIAEYALMINGEGWLKDGIKANIKFVTVDNYNHTYFYVLPIKPSPNLPNMNAVYLYPSLCLFEGTILSVGRGTEKPFQIFGHPELRAGSYTFTPRSMQGAMNPPLKDNLCYGFDVSDFAEIFIKNYNEIYLFWLIGAYEEMPQKENLFNNLFDKLAGTDKLRKQIIEGLSETEIKATWQNDIRTFKTIRKRYLLYPDFE